MYLNGCSVAQENYFYSNTDKECTMGKSEDHSGESPLHSKAFFFKKNSCSINKYLHPESWTRAGMYSGQAAQDVPNM